MGNTIYASFADPSLAEKAAGALLDYGVKSEDISIVRSSGDGLTINQPACQNDYGSSTSGQDYTNRRLDDAQPVASTDAGYTSTGNTETWTETETDVEENRRSYVGSTYLTETPGPLAGSAVSPQDVANSNVGYGDTAYRAGALDQDYRTTSNDVDREGDIETAAKEGISTTTGADAGAGAAKGAGWGLGVGILAGIASLVVPGFGIILGGGALATAIGGAIATTGGGAIAGAVTGYLKDQGIEDHVAAQYTAAVESGGAIIALTVPSGSVDEIQARQILDKYGAGNLVNQPTRGYVA